MRIAEPFLKETEVFKTEPALVNLSAFAPNGALILSDLGVMITAYGHNDSKAVLLADGKGSTDLDGKNPTAFTSWQIVTAQENLGLLRAYPAPAV